MYNQFMMHDQKSIKLRNMRAVDSSKNAGKELSV